MDMGISPPMNSGIIGISASPQLRSNTESEGGMTDDGGWRADGRRWGDDRRRTGGVISQEFGKIFDKKDGLRYFGAVAVGLVVVKADLCNLGS